MLPIDSEFLLLYGTYLSMLIILVVGYQISKRKGMFRKNLISFFVYTLLMVFLFSNEENFKHGSSLMVLFLGALFILIHFLVLLIILVVTFIGRNKTGKLR
jgi:hypothetical protein